MIYRLRDYQSEMLDRLLEEWGRYRGVMVQMPTGTGKTVLMAEVIRQFTEDGGTVLVVAHRRELIEQIRQTIRSFDIDNGKVRVESIQKLYKADYKSDITTPGLVIVDEAHHALAKTYSTLWERWPQAKFLGLTATPCRLNGAAFTDLFEVLLQSWDIQEFIDKGWLSDFEYVSAAPENLLMKQVGQLRKRGADGDYQTKEMVTVMDVPESISHLYKTYEAFAWGKKGIV
ncbi:MAG: DEAD/DEAH box helicase family protein, partial [Prevotella sp.]|nr:DEAD/DEAH box helicase family protein [Prevotella sp.]